MFIQDRLKNIPYLDLGYRSSVFSNKYNIGEIDFIRWDEVIYPVMKGVDIYNRPFLVLKIMIDQKPIMQTFFQKHTYNNDIWMGIGHTGYLLKTYGGITEQQTELIYSIIENKQPVIEEIHRPYKSSYLGKRIMLYDEKKWEASKKIQRAWRNCRYNPIYKMCERVLFRNMDRIREEYCQTLID